MTKRKTKNPSEKPHHAPSSSEQTPQKRARYGHFSSDPTLSGYENLIGTCRNCSKDLVVNRATDLRGTYPSVGVTFRCTHCSRMLRVSGDIANHPVDQFVYDAYEPLLRRRYMQCVLMLAQSLELALALCVTAWLFGNVKYRRTKVNNAELAELRQQVDAQVNKLPLGGLRRLAAALAIWQVRPTSLAEARSAVAQLGSLRNRRDPAASVGGIADEALREAVRLLLNTNFVDLRNAVAHHAYRPTQSAAERCYERIPKMNRLLMNVFGAAKGQLVMPPRAA